MQIIHIPKAFVKPFDPREQDVSADAPDALSRYEPPTENQLAVLDTQDALERLAARIGWKRLAIICRNLADINEGAI